MMAMPIKQAIRTAKGSESACEVSELVKGHVPIAIATTIVTGNKRFDVSKMPPAPAASLVAAADDALLLDEADARDDTDEREDAEDASEDATELDVCPFGFWLRTVVELGCELVVLSVSVVSATPSVVADVLAARVLVSTGSSAVVVALLLVVVGSSTTTSCVEVLLLLVVVAVSTSVKSSTIEVVVDLGARATSARRQRSRSGSSPTEGAGAGAAQAKVQAMAKQRK